MSTQTRTKDFQVAVEIKDELKGDVEAVIATLGVVDRDKDVIRPGAIKNGSDVVVSMYAHDVVTGGKIPVGDGTVSVEGNKAIFRGSLWLELQQARDVLAVLKRRGTRQEWSFGYKVLNDEAPTDIERRAGAQNALTELETLEVSPVFRGAGIGTRTLAVKQSDGDPGEPVVVPAPVAETVEAVAETPIDPAPTEAEQEAARGKAFGADIFARFEKTRSRLAS